MNWTDVWFALPNYSTERAMLLSIAWAEAARQGDSALLSNLQMNILDGYGVCNRVQLAGIQLPLEASRLIGAVRGMPLR